jgi:hypothetical protein
MVFQQWGKRRKVADNGVSAMGENGERLLTVVFQQWGKW